MSAPSLDTNSFRPVRAQRSRGSARLAVRCDANGVTRLRDLAQGGCARLRLPRSSPGVAAPLEAIAINTGGGLTGGDHVDWSIEVGARAAASVTSQACERIYRASHGTARIDVRLDLEEGASLFWWPQETIVFDRGAVRRTIEAIVPETARLLVVEATLFGRAAMGERFERGSIRDDWRIRRPDGRLIHAEALRIEGGSDLAGPAALDGAGAVANLLLVAPDAERHLDTARTILEANGAASGAASCWNGRLLARIVAADGYELRRTLVPLAASLAGCGVPRGWSF